MVFDAELGQNRWAGRSVGLESPQSSFYIKTVPQILQSKRRKWINYAEELLLILTGNSKAYIHRLF